MHDTLEVFGTRLPFGGHLSARNSSRFTPACAAQARRYWLQGHHGGCSQGSDDIRRSEICTEHALDPEEEVRQAFYYGLVEVFGA